jgi:acetyltransferase
MVRYRKWTTRERTEERVFDVDRKAVQQAFQRALEAGRKQLPEYEALGVLAAYGFPVARTRLVRSREALEETAAGVGFPLVMKIASPDILHKTEVKGVRVGLADASAVQAAYDEMMAHVRSVRPDAEIWGVALQEMAPPGKEVIVGSTRDPKFGPLVMFGLGGIYTEAMKDVTFRLAPLRQLSARKMLEEIRGRRILEGVRGEAPADLDAIEECLERLSQLVVEFPVVKELDINPLMAYPKGVLAADARIVLDL